MKLTIQHWNGETFSVEIDATEYIDDLKDKIEELHDVPVDQQRLTYNGEEVDDTETIQENNITDNATLLLEAMKITIILPKTKVEQQNKKIRLTLRPDDSIKKIKKAAAKKSGGLKMESLVVLFDGAELRDGQKLSDCNIDHGDVVIVESFTVTVAHWEGDLITIDNVTMNDTTDKIKDILMETRDIPKENQKFKYKGNPIHEYLSFKDQQIKHKAVIQLEKPVVKKEKKKFELSVFPTETPMNKESKKITVTVKHWNGSTFNVEATPDQYMEELKEEIQKVSSIPVDHQRLTLSDGTAVDDTETLEEQNIEDKTVLTLEAMKIVVALPGGKKKLRFVVVPEDIVKRIKRLVAKKSGIPVERQRVMFNGDDLKDTETLAACNVDHEDVLTIDTFAITVRHWDGEVIEIKDTLSPNDTTDDVKRILMERKDIPKEQLKLQFEGKDINDFLSLKDQKIAHRSILQLQEPPKEKPKKEKFKLQLFPTDDPAAAKATKGDAGETITIKNWKGETFTVECGLSDYIEDLKDKIEKQHKVLKAQQRLSLDGTILDDSETLADHNIDASTTINLEAMKIHIMLPNGKKIRFAINLDDTVRRIKKIVTKKTGMQADSQCLMLAGTEIFDNQKLAEVGIDHDDHLTVEPFSISVLHWLGDIFVLPDVQPNDTMEDVRNIILKRKQIPKEKQQFKFEGRHINDFLSLKDQKIRHKSIITMEDLDVIKSPRKKRPSVQEIKYVDTSDEDSFGDTDDDASDDGSEASWLKRAAHEDFTKGLSIDLDDPDDEEVEEKKEMA